MKFLITIRKQLLLYISIFLGATAAQSQVTFQKVYGGPDTDEGFAVLQTNDGGYIVAGSAITGSVQGLYLLRTNSYGDIVFTKIYLGFPFSVSIVGGYSIAQTSDHGFIVAGTVSMGAPNYNIFLLKTDSNGVLLWKKVFGDSGNDDRGLSVTETTDGGYAIGGMVDYNMCLIKTDSNGNLIWKKIIGYTSQDQCNSIQQTSDGGFILAGSTMSTTTWKDEAYLVKTNSSGDTLWCRSYGWSTGYVEAYDVKQTLDGGYIAVGYFTNIGFSNPDFFAVKITAAGDTLWCKTFGGNGEDVSYCVVQTADSNYVIVGSTNSFGFGDDDVLLIKIDTAGNLLWSKAYGGFSHDEGRSIKETADHGFIITGITASFTPNLWDVYLIKTDEDGNSGCNAGTALVPGDSHAMTVRNAPTLILNDTLPEAFFNDSIISGGFVMVLCISPGVADYASQHRTDVYPNPFSSQLTFETDFHLKHATLSVSNCVGQRIKQIQDISGRSFILERGNLPGGLYFLQLVEDQKIIMNRKVLIVD